MAQLIVFDCDGTLVDSQQAMVQAVQEAFGQYDQPIPARADILQCIGLPIDVSIQQFLPHASAQLRAQLVRAWVQTSERLEKQSDRGQVMFSGMQDVLRYVAAQAHLRLGVITMKSRKGLERVLQVYKLKSYVDVTKTADDGPGKPSPVLLQQAMEECRVTPDNTMMVGDTVYDIQMAKSANVYALGVAWGYQTVAELKESGADHIVDMPVQLLDFIRHAQWQAS